MTGTIRWARGLSKADPADVQRRVDNLLREGTAVLAELESLCFEVLDRLLDRTDATRDEVAVTYIGAQYLDSLSAFRSLIRQGRIRAALNQLRSMVEARVVMEFIRGDEQRAERWWNAEMQSELLEFSFERTYRSATEAETWKFIWDMCRNKVHTNYGAFPVQSRMRPIYGGDTFVGPFYDPVTIANLFSMVLAITQWFAQLLGRWYEEQRLFPPDFGDRLDSICRSFKPYEGALQRRALEEDDSVKREPGTLPLEQQKEAATLFEAWRRQGLGNLWLPRQ